MKPLIYVAGPMQNNQLGCVREVMPVFRWLRERGAVPFLPQLSVLMEMIDPWAYEHYMAYDFDIIAHCQALVRLPGESAGATREMELAEQIGIPVFHWNEDGAQIQLAGWLRNVGASA